ncbi:hypothetical protein SAMN04487943_10356 [Gracilibacillus orientalis]|uniref:Uncharacterized protein n=1 Tax=Gracilibacillus orientalis TaxID=334253 RepID=A0A1I4JNK7_9BACI|nr:hypothetical protein SAMN04487943_10356 [Gracilibacillus orientalis]
MNKSFKKISIVSDLLLFLSFVVGYCILYFSGIAVGNGFALLLIILVFGLISFFSKAVIYTLNGELRKSIAMYFLSFLYLVLFFVILALMLNS